MHRKGETWILCLLKRKMSRADYTWSQVHAIKIQAQTLNVNAMEGDYRNTGQCNLDVTREKYLPQFVGYALQKNSPYARQIDQGYALEQCLQQK